MTRFKLFAAAAVLSAVIAGPALAQDVVYHRDHYYRRGPVGAAADVAGAAIGTAGAIATAPFRNSYNYDRLRPGYGSERLCLSPRNLVQGRGWPPTHLSVTTSTYREAANSAASLLSGQNLCFGITGLVALARLPRKLPTKEQAPQEG